MSPKDVCEHFDEEIKTLTRQIYVKRAQHSYYNSLKENIDSGEMILHVDYSENYANKQQGERQSAYFGHFFYFYCMLLSTR